MICLETGSFSCIRKAANIIRDGGVVAFPTETVYGLGADAFKPTAVEKIFQLKGRPSNNPLIVHIDSLYWLDFLYKFIPDWAYLMMERLWPGPLSIILPAKTSVPLIVRGGLETVAVRMPAHPYALKLIEYSGTPIAAPSANVSGRPSPTAARHVFEDFDEDLFIIDGGSTLVGVESTVVDASSVPLKIYRLGAVTPDDIEAVTGKPVEVHIKPKDGRPLSPGHAYRHYAPNKPMYVFSDEDELKTFIERRSTDVVVIALEEYKELLKMRVNSFISLGNNVKDAAARLYMALRDADKLQGSAIVALMVPEEGVGMAVNERLKRAAIHVIGGEKI